MGLDPRGAVVSAIGIGLLVLGIIEGPERGWTDPFTLVGLIGGVVFLVGFIWVELRTDEPLLDPRLFSHRGFATGSASLFLQFFAMFGFFFVSLQFLQLVLGYSTFEAALALLPMSIVILPISAVAGHAVGDVRAPARSAASASRCRRSGSGCSPRSGPAAGSLALHVRRPS